VSIAAACLCVIIASLAGYAMSRYKGWVVTSYSRFLLMIQMFPLILAIIPLFILFRNLNLINNPLSVIFIYTVANLSFSTWMFKSFFDGIPRELEESASVDGCTPLQGLVRIVLPLAGPGTIAVAIFSFLLAFNEFFIANVFLRQESSMTLPVGIQIFTQQFGSDWGSLMAAATLTMLPTFCLFLFVQKYMLYGAIGAGVKG
jgi:ABC-type glycerol-3-phosphate transport system permease component